jgi:PPOX class probable F420-dependent enzyme
VAELTDDARQKLREANIWLLATVMEDGSAQVTPVWVDVDDGHVIVNTAIGRLKERNVRRDPRVTLALAYPENPYAWCQIRGRVVELVEGQPAFDSIDALAKKYLGEDTYPYLQPGEERVMLRIEPTRVITG